MGMSRIWRAIAPFTALAAAAGLAGCGVVNTSFNGEEGVPLAELDTSGAAPTGVALGGPDQVVITQGDAFRITVDGTDAANERLRFVLSDGTLAIGRVDGDWADSDYATVNITMPNVSSIAIGGSGRVTTNSMSGDAEIVIGGSGEAVANGVAADNLEVIIGGSGRAQLAGQTEGLEISIGGSGTADMAALQANRAEVNIGGSGNATFASDGTVEATIAGSGTVRVRGSASCTINSVGSGRLICEESNESVAEDA